MKKFKVLSDNKRRGVEGELRALLEEIVKCTRSTVGFIAYIESGTSKAHSHGGNELNDSFYFVIQPELWIKRQDDRGVVWAAQDGLTGLATKNGVPVIYPSDPGSKESYIEVSADIASEMVAPFHCENCPSGVVLLDRIAPAESFSEHDRSTLIDYVKRIEEILNPPPAPEIIEGLDSLVAQCLDRTSSLRGYIAIKAFDGSIKYMHAGKDTELFLELSSTEGLCGEVFQIGRPCNIGNVLNCQGYVPSAVEIQSECIFPITHRGLTIGIVNMESPVKDHFGVDRESIIRETAELAGKFVMPPLVKPQVDYFYGLWDLFEFIVYTLDSSAREDVDDVQQQVLAKLCTTAHYVTHSTSAAFWLRESKEGVPAIFSDFLPDGASGPEAFDDSAFDEGKSLPTDDGKILVFDELMLYGKVLGRLGVTLNSTEDPDVPVEAQAMLHRLVQIVATAFRRRMMQNQYKVFLNSVRGISRKDASEVDIAEAVRAIPSMLECDHCTLFVRVTNDRFYPFASSSDSVLPHGSETFYSSEQEKGLVPFVIRRKLSLKINNVMDKQEMRRISKDLNCNPPLESVGRLVEELEPKFRSMLVVPVEVGDEICGVLRAYRNIDSRRSGFASFEVNMMETVCSLLGRVLRSSKSI